jgi:hypothetical protein
MALPSPMARTGFWLALLRAIRAFKASEVRPNEPGDQRRMNRGTGKGASDGLGARNASVVMTHFTTQFSRRERRS